MPSSGSFSSPGVSASYTPPTANSTFSVLLSGNGYVCYLTTSVGGAPQALIFDANCSTKYDGAPVVFYAPTAVQFNMPFTAPGQPTPTYQLVGRVIGSGGVQYQFNP